MRRAARRLALAAILLAPAAALLAAGCGTDVTLGGDLPACAGEPCGAACPKGFCDGEGNCSTAPPSCGMSSCAGQPCGATCPPPPMPLPGPFACDGKGACVPGPASCIDGCHGRSCGALCDPGCDPEAPGGCPPPPLNMACDMMGHCVDAVLVGCMGRAPYFPCKGKACGKLCHICAPGDPMCTEAPVPKACDPAGTCTPVVMCP